MNRVFLPAVSRKYGTELADVRGVWKRYLKENKLTMVDLLKKEKHLIHLNEYGNGLMAEIIQSHLRRRPELPDDAWNDRVKTYSVGPEGDVDWKNGKLVLPFEGNKVDLICKEGKSTPAAIRIDGKKPSEFPELYSVDRTEMVAQPLFPPILLRVQAEKPRFVEAWNMTITDIAEGNQFRFKVSGSITGEDGEGESGKRFVSKSGRVAIDPEDILIVLAKKWLRERNGRAIELCWRVVPFFADEFRVPAKRNPFGETTVIAAQGLSNGKHTLEITGGPDTPLAAIRVHRPPLGRQ